MKLDYRNLANPNIRDLVPYQPGLNMPNLSEIKNGQCIRLASNENPLGPSPHIIKAITEILPMAHRYPDGDCLELKAQLSEFLSVDVKQLTIGNGSENILELIIKAFLHEGKTAIISEYAFLTIPLLLTSYGSKIKIIPALNWKHNLIETLASITNDTRIIFLVNPNNPTGTYINENEFIEFMDNVPENILVVMDEAYSEYNLTDDYPNSIAILNRYANLIITRTFSKIYGLAALRIGYAISTPVIADVLNRARLPFNVNAIASKAACLALQDKSHIQKSIAMNTQGMAYITNELQKLSIPFITSIGNFISIQVGEATHTFLKLLEQGVIVRPLNAYNLEKYIRVTIGTPEQNVHFIQALKTIHYLQ